MKAFFSNQNAGRTLSPKQLKKLSRWEKERSQGKWFWIFRRTSIWFVAVILMFGALSFYSPESINLEDGQFFVAVFMLGGYVIDSIMDWSKMEKLYQSMALTND
jgi:hypothetical protein